MLEKIIYLAHAIIVAYIFSKYSMLEKNTTKGLTLFILLIYSLATLGLLVIEKNTN